MKTSRIKQTKLPLVETKPLFETKGVFSDHYIKTKLKGSNIWPDENTVTSIYAVRLIDMLFETPYIKVKNVVELLKISSVAANALVNRFEKIGILNEIVGKQRYKKCIFKDYIEIIARGTEKE